MQIAFTRLLMSYFEVKEINKSPELFKGYCQKIRTSTDSIVQICSTSDGDNVSYRGSSEVFIAKAASSSHFAWQAWQNNL